MTSTLERTPTPLLLWNASESAPIGLYRLKPAPQLAKGDMVAAIVPEPFRQLADHRRYVPADVPLIKRVRAIGGDYVCTRGKWLLINSQFVAPRLRTDSRGRMLPWWRGCRTLASDEFMLLGDHPRSFDSRYFGPVQRTAILGRTLPLWQR